MNKELNPIFYYIVMSLIIDLVSFYYVAVHNGNSLSIALEKISLATFIISEFGFFMAFIYRNIWGPTRKKITIGIILLFYIYTLISFTIFKRTEGYDKFTFRYVSISTLDSVSLIIASFFYFYELFKSSGYIDLKKLPQFWVAAAILFYNCCSLPIFVFVGPIYTTSPYYSRIIFSLNFIFYCLLYLMFIKAYLCKKTVPYN